MCDGCYTEAPDGREWARRMRAFYTAYPETEFGPAHIVIGDDNLEDGHILYCLRDWDKNVRDWAAHGSPRDPVDLAAAWCWLKYLLTFPESVRLAAKARDEDDEGRLTRRVPSKRITKALETHRYAV